MVLEMLHCKELQLFSLFLLLLLLEMQTLNLNSPLVQASAVQTFKVFAQCCTCNVFISLPEALMAFM